MEIENEIELLESTLSYLESAMAEVADSSYFSHLSNSWELDAEQIRSQLEELYSMQNEMWARELKAQNFDYERSVI